MNTEEFLLVQLASECAELAQEALKASQFGLSSRKPGQKENNEQRLFAEYVDVLGTFQALVDHGVLWYNVGSGDASDFDKGINEKVKKINFYLSLLKESGKVVD